MASRQAQAFVPDEKAQRKADPNKRWRWMIPLVIAAQVAFKVGTRSVRLGLNTPRCWYSFTRAGIEPRGAPSDAVCIRHLHYTKAVTIPSRDSLFRQAGCVLSDPELQHVAREAITGALWSLSVCLS